jgi:hypothetical protein
MSQVLLFDYWSLFKQKYNNLNEKSKFSGKYLGEIYRGRIVFGAKKIRVPSW